MYFFFSMIFAQEWYFLPFIWVVAIDIYGHCDYVPMILA
jgi:hypothetical protein